mgnify:CR=1 FL=1
MLTVEKKTLVTTTNINPEYRVQSLLVGLSLEDNDDVLLSYIDFLADVLPVEQITFLHVLPRFDMFNIQYETEADGLVSNFEIDRDIVFQMQAEIKSRFAGKRLQPVFAVQEGDPLEALLFETGQTKADLVVIGQRNGSGPHGILARNLARKTTCPALIIPQEAACSLGRIVVPVDFSKNSVNALQSAADIATATGAELIAVNIFELPSLNAYRINKTVEELRELIMTDRYAAFEAFIQTHLRNYAGRLKTQLVERDWNSVAHHLLDFARAEGADLIVMGAKGHSRVERLLMGSVTEDLLAANETIPTLVVK